MLRIAVLVVAVAALTGCTDEPAPAPTPSWHTVELDGLRFSVPAGWRSLPVTKMINTQESMIGVLGSVPLAEACLSSRGCVAPPFDLSGGGIGIVVSNNGNFGLRRLPEGPGYSICAAIAGMRCARRTIGDPLSGTHADRVIEWTLKPDEGDLIVLRAHLTGDADQDAIAEDVVASMQRE